MKPYHIVITTIGDGSILWPLASNLITHRHLDDTKVWIIPDLKTPPACAEQCRKVSEMGLDVVYMDVMQQDYFSSKYEPFYSRLLWNTDARRNVGYLAALEDGCKWLILLDDDNYPDQDDLIGWHTLSIAPNLVTDEPYYNYMTALDMPEVYPRGYPYTGRTQTSDLSVGKPAEKIGVSLGLWSGSPDIDAMTGLVRPRLISAGIVPGDKWALPKATWTPINSQNTAIRRELIPAALFVPQKYANTPAMFNRYGDIFGGYFLQSIMNQTDYQAAFGRPVVVHKRNAHNPVADMQDEHAAIVLLEWMLPRLREWRGISSDVTGLVKELAGWLMGLHRAGLNGLRYNYRAWIYETSITLSAWADACRKAASDG